MKAQHVCDGFMEFYDWSDAAVCVAKCLVRSESYIRKLPHCSDRAVARIVAHARCYSECEFIPTRWLPPGGWDVGLGDLIGVCRTCKDGVIHNL
jgi:hypothetical protein